MHAIRVVLRTSRSLLHVLALLALAACGGGSGGGSGGGTIATLAGAWRSAAFQGHASVLYLTERADGRAVGYLPADPSLRVVDGGRVGNRIALAFVQEDPGLLAMGSFNGTLSADGTAIDGTYDDGSGAVPVAFTRWSTPLTVEEWLVVDFAQDRVLRGTRLGDGAGGFVTGGFVGLDGCGFLACAGDWTSWSVTGPDHALASSSGGMMATTANLVGSWTPMQHLVIGTYTTSLDPTVRDWAAGRVGLCESSHATQVLDTIATLLDALEAESASAVDALADTYLHGGRTKAEVQADLLAVFAAYDDLEAKAVVRQIISANSGDEHPDVVGPPRVEWALEVTGVPAAGGARETALALDTANHDQEDLRWIALGGGTARFSGDGYATPFEIELPIQAGDSAKLAFRIWPWGVHGGGHPEGHPGWDFEYACGTQVRAAAAGTISEIRPNDGWPGQWTVTISHRPGRSTRYDHLENLAPGITAGASVTTGQILADAGMTGLHCITHFTVRTGTDDVCPEPFLSVGARTLFDTLWADAAYNEELCEPLVCNPLEVAFPLTRAWSRETGSLAPTIEFTRLDPNTSDYRYTLRDAGGNAFESGVVSQGTLAMPNATIDLVPDGGGATHLGVYDIVGDTMWIDWDDVTRPASLAGASRYRFGP